MSAADTEPAFPPIQIFPSGNVRYVKIVSMNADGTHHTHIIDEEACVRFGSTLADLIKENLTDDQGAQAPCSSSSLVDDPPAEGEIQTLSNIQELPFDTIEKQVMDVVAPFMYWKKRWNKVVDEKIPDQTFFPKDNKELVQKIFMASTELSC